MKIIIVALESEVTFAMAGEKPVDWGRHLFVGESGFACGASQGS